MTKDRIQTALTRLNEEQDKIMKKVKADPYLVDWSDTYELYLANDAKSDALCKALIAIDEFELAEYHGEVYLARLKKLNEFLNNTIKHYV